MHCFQGFGRYCVQLDTFVLTEHNVVLFDELSRNKRNHTTPPPYTPSVSLCTLKSERKISENVLYCTESPFFVSRIFCFLVNYPSLFILMELWLIAGVSVSQKTTN